MADRAAEKRDKAQLTEKSQSTLEASVGRKAKSKSKAPSIEKHSKASEKNANRRQKAFEKQFLRAEKELSEQQTAFPLTEAASSHPSRSEQLSPSGDVIRQAWSPEGASEQSFHLSPQACNETEVNPFSCPATIEWQPGPSIRSDPVATLAPTAPGLHQGENLTSDLPEDIKSLRAQTISQGIAAGFQQIRAPTALATEPSTSFQQDHQTTGDRSHWHGTQSPNPSLDSEDSLLQEEG